MRICPIPLVSSAVIVWAFAPPGHSKGSSSGNWSNKLNDIPIIISDLKDSRAELLEAVEGLSRRELTELHICDDWTIKDILAHVIGWDQHVQAILPLMLQNRTNEIAGIETDDFNRKSVVAWRDKSWPEVLV